jgi:RNA polymerase sigma factor (sigma-70 family)
MLSEPSHRTAGAVSTAAAVRAELRELLGAVRAGSEDAARTLVDLYGPHILQAVRRRLHRKLRSQYDSADFVQAVWASFLALRTSEIPLDSPAALVRYLAGIARNKMIDAFRKRVTGPKRKADREAPLTFVRGARDDGRGDLPGREPTPSKIVMAEEKWAEFLRSEPPHVRHIMQRLRRGEEAEKIARDLGVGDWTVRRAIRRLARKLLSS